MVWFQHNVDQTADVVELKPGPRARLTRCDLLCILHETEIMASQNPALAQYSLVSVRTSECQSVVKCHACVRTKTIRRAQQSAGQKYHCSHIEKVATRVVESRTAGNRLNPVLASLAAAVDDTDSDTHPPSFSSDLRGGRTATPPVREDVIDESDSDSADDAEAQAEAQIPCESLFVRVNTLSMPPYDSTYLVSQ